jgi:hypothetical protein
MWSPTRLPFAFSGVDVKSSSPALELEAVLDIIEASVFADSPGPRP